MLRGGYPKLQAVVPTRLLLAIFCCLLFLGLALTTIAQPATQPSAAHTINSQTNHRKDCHSIQRALDQHASHKHASDQHSTDLLAICCAWICAAHAVLPNTLAAVFQPVQRVLTDPSNFVRIQNPQLAHVRPIERPPRLFA